MGLHGQVWKSEEFVNYKSSWEIEKVNDPEIESTGEELGKDVKDVKDERKERILEMNNNKGICNYFKESSLCSSMYEDMNSINVPTLSNSEEYLTDNFRQQLYVLGNMNLGRRTHTAERISLRKTSDRVGLEEKPSIILNLEGVLLFLPTPCASISTATTNINLITTKMGTRCLLRPYAKEFLRLLKTQFEVILFTDWEDDYTMDIVHAFEAQQHYFDFVLSRRHCSLNADLVLKELNLIKNREINHIIILDSSLVNWPSDLDNLVPIIPFTDILIDHDLELPRIFKYLLYLKNKTQLQDKNSQIYPIADIVEDLKSELPQNGIDECSPN